MRGRSFAPSSGWLELHVRPEAAGLREDLEPGGRIGAERTIALRRVEERHGPLDRELVGCEVLGDRGPSLAALEVGPVAPDAGHHRDAVGRHAERDGVDLARVDVAEVLAHHVLEAGVLLQRGLLTEVEAGEPRCCGLLDAARDLVEVVLHACGERVVDEVGEVVLEEGHHAEGGEGRHERRALLPDVPAVLDRAHDRRIGRRATDAELLEALHERGLGEAGRGLGGVRVGGELAGVDVVALRHGGQATLGVVTLGVVVDVLDVDAPKARLGDDRARRTESDPRGGTGRGGVGLDADDDGLAGGVDHLRGHGALPDELVDPRFARGQLTSHLLGRAERVARRTDRLVRLLGVLDLGGVHARGRRGTYSACRSARR